MSLIVKIGADVGAFKRGINTVSKDITTLGKGIKNTGNKFMPLTYGAAGIFSGAIKAGGDFQAMMSKVSAIGQVYGKDLDELSKKARQIGKDTKFTATEAAEGMVYMSQAGWKASETLDGIDHVMNLAAASGVNVARVSDIVTDAITAMGASSKDTAKYVDLMAITASKSNTNVDLMGDTYQYASQIAGTLGINMQDLSLAIGLMANSSVKGRQAGTSLRGGLVNLVKPTNAQAAAMKRYNISLIKNKDGSVDLRGTMINLRKQIKGLDKDEQAMALSTIFGKNALSGWSAIVNASEKDFNDMANAIDNATGSTDKMAKTMMDNSKGDITIMLSSIEGALISVFEAIAPVVTDVANTITSLANAFDGLDEGKKKAIVIGIAIAGIIGPVMKLTGNVITLGGKLKAIPVALRKMNDRSVERQVNAWLKWHKVSDEQAAKLRRVARDLDKVNRDGANAKTSANRLNKELKNIRMKNQAASEMKDLAKSADKAGREVSELKRELNTVKSKNVKINTTNTSRTITKGDKKVKGGKKTKGVKGIGKEIVGDVVTEIGGELGGKALQSIGGEIFGSIIGEGLASSLAEAALGGAGLKGVFGGLASTLGPVALGVGAVGTALWAFHKAADNSKSKVELLGNTIEKDGKKMHEFKGATQQANETLNGLLDNMVSFDAQTGKVKTIKTKQNIDIEGQKKSQIENIKKQVAERMKIREMAIQQDKAMTQKEKEEQIKAEQEKYKAIQDIMINSTNFKMEYMKTWNEGYGKQQWEAGERMLLEDLELLKQGELLHATSEQEKMKIAEKYRGLEKQALADFLVSNQTTLMQGLQTELNMIEENKSMKLQVLEEQHAQEMQKISERYSVGTPKYKKAVEEEMRAYERKKNKIVNGAQEEKAALGEFISKQIESAVEMAKTGQITQEECDKIVKAMQEVGESDPDVKVHMDLSSYHSQRRTLMGQLANPFTQRINLVYNKPSNPPSGTKVEHRATGGSLNSGLTVVGERGPELISRRGSSVSVQPLRATDRAAGGWSKRDLVGMGGGDTFQVTIVGHNKSAKELFDEIEEYKNNMDRHKGKRRY